MRYPGFAHLRLVSTLVLALVALMLPGAQSTAQVATLPVTTGITVVTSFSGIDPSTSNPPDLTIAAGPDRLVIGSNDVVVIRGKDGSLKASRDLRTFFAAARRRSTVFSPRVVFDPDSERFFLVAAANDLASACNPATTCVSRYLLAVSTSNSPVSLDSADPGPGDWAFYSLDATLDNAVATRNFADFTDIGVNEQAVVITSIQRDMATTSFVTAKVRRLPKALLVAGTPVFDERLAGLRRDQRSRYGHPGAGDPSGGDVRHPGALLPDQPRAGPGEQRLQHGRVVARQPAGR